jgi:hypothetical protein
MKLKLLYHNGLYPKNPQLSIGITGFSVRAYDESNEDTYFIRYSTGYLQTPLYSKMNRQELQPSTHIVVPCATEVFSDGLILIDKDGFDITSSLINLTSDNHRQSYCELQDWISNLKTTHYVESLSSTYGGYQVWEVKPTPQYKGMISDSTLNTLCKVFHSYGFSLGVNVPEELINKSITFDQVYPNFFKGEK